MDGAGQFGRAAAIDDLIAFDKITHGAEGIMNTALGLVDDLVAAASHENSEGLGLGAFFNDEHAFVSGSEMQFFDSAGETEFLLGNFLETGDDAGTSGHGDELDIVAADPADRRQLVL